MNKTSILKICEIALHVVGFPLLLVIAFIINIDVIKKGAQYGVSAFVFAFIIALFAIIYYVAYFILVSQEKKRRAAMSKQSESAKNLRVKIARKADPARRTGLVLAIVVVCCLSGFWALLDVALPDVLADKGTSRTIFYEDLADGWADRAVVNQELLDTYITRSYNAGKLKNKTLDEYLKEGFRNKEVADMIKADYESIDKNGYGTFVGPSIDFAQNGRMTINAIVHILLDDRTPVVDDSGARLDYKIPLTTYKVESISAAQDALADDVKIKVGESYLFMRSTRKYFLYTNALDKAGADFENMIIYEETAGYRTIQYLSAKKNLRSILYTIEKNGEGLVTYTEQVYLNEALESETIIRQTSGSAATVIVKVADASGFITETYNVNASFTKTENGYTVSTTSDEYEVEVAVEAANVIMDASKEDIYSKDVCPSAWSGATVDVCMVKGKTEEYATWDVFDMLGTDTTFALPLDSIKNMEFDIGIKITVAALLENYQYLIHDVLSSASALMSDEAIVGSDVYVSLDLETGELAISPCNEERGVLDYMRQAWLQNNGLIYIIVSLFSLRKLFLAYAGFFALISYLLGMVREYRLRDQKPEEEGEGEGGDEPEEEAPVSQEEVLNTDV